MRLNILIGGKAGQGINKISEIVSAVLVKQGYFTFNYRDYPSLIRGGHNFNVLSISDFRVGSMESKLDGIVALDRKTTGIHKKNLKKGGFVIDFKKYEKQNLGRNLNVALSGALIKLLGLDKRLLIKEVKGLNKEAVNATKKGYDSEKIKFHLKKLNNKIDIMTGSQAMAVGAVNSGINLYFGYPMTPATGVLNEIAAYQLDKKIKNKLGLVVYQPENEIAVVNAGLGAGFTGARVMVGTSGGGFDLMSEGISLAGQAEIPIVIYLASRPGPGTGVPTYTSQADLDIALRAGHGEFPRIVVAPGDPIECIEKTNEAFYLAEKFKIPVIVLADKHLAESEFSSDRKPNKILKVDVKRKIPGKSIVKVNSYEDDGLGNTTESAIITAKNAEARIKKYENIKKQVRKFEMIKIFGNKNSKNLVIGWGSTKTVILDAVDGLDCKFLQVLYMKPIGDEIRKEIEKAKKIVIIENNVTGQLGRLIREKTGIKIIERIVKYDGRPFKCDELRKEIKGRLR